MLMRNYIVRSAWISNPWGSGLSQESRLGYQAQASIVETRTRVNQQLRRYLLLRQTEWTNSYQAKPKQETRGIGGSHNILADVAAE
jgi:hypothetical protein